MEVLKSDSKVKVSGVNIAKKHRKPSQDNPGKIEEIELPIHASNISILDPKTGKPTRIKFIVENDKKKRVTVSSNSEI